MANRKRRRPRRDHGHGLPGPDDGLRPLPRPQVRPDLAGRVLPVPGLLQQRQRARRVHRNARECSAPGLAAEAQEKQAAQGARGRARSGQEAGGQEGDRKARQGEGSRREGDHQRDGDGRHAPSRGRRIVLKRGRYDMPDTSRQVEPGVPSSLPPLPNGARRQSPRPGRMAGRARESADGASGRQPDLAAPFRHRSGEDGREFRRSGRAAVAP